MEKDLVAEESINGFLAGECNGAAPTTDDAALLLALCVWVCVCAFRRQQLFCSSSGQREQQQRRALHHRKFFRKFSQPKIFADFLALSFFPFPPF